MKLVSFSPQYLRPDEPLPFGLRDGTGRLLLAAGQRLESREHLAGLVAQPLFADEGESAGWTRRLAAAMDAMLRQNAPLRDVAQARPEPMSQREQAAGAGVERGLPEQWEDLVGQLDGALRDVKPGGDWMARLLATHERARQLAARRIDGSLYHLVYEAGHSTQKYSSHHAMLTMLICEQAAPLIGWPAEAIGSLSRAALTMNVAMLRLQDQLAQSDLPVSPAMRAEIESHPQAGAVLLAECGFGDKLALDVVRLHHEAGEATRPLAELPPARQLARLLRRVDIFSAKISRRASRQPMSPVQAAGEACLGAGGVPDEIGGALLKAVGMYPPGSFVELVTGEVAIVVARGRRANLPVVASFVSASGTPLGEPALRDTVDRRYSVKAAVPPSQVRVRPPHDRVLALR